MARNDVDVLNFVDVGFDKLTLVANRNPLLGNDVAISLDSSVSDVGIFFVVGGQIDNFGTNLETGLPPFGNFSTLR